MGDRASASVAVWKVAGKETAIAAIMEKHSLGLDWGSAGPIEPSDVVDGLCFVDDEANLAVLEYLGPDLMALEVPFIAHQDAKYEFDGEVLMYAPLLGQFRNTCTQDGNVTVLAEDIDVIVDTWMESVERSRVLLGAVDALTGRRWREYFAELARETEEAHQSEAVNR